MDNNLSALCASHIECVQRVIYLHYMLKSWHNQTKPCKLYLSISFSNNLKMDIEHLIKHWKATTTLFNCTIRPEKCSQFEHYKMLLAENNDLDWVIFTDDDDLWNTCRVEKYLECDLKDKQIYCINNIISSYDIYSYNIYQIKNTCKWDKTCEYITLCLQAKLCIKVINDIIEDKFLLTNQLFDLKFKNWLLKNYNINMIESDTFLYYYRQHVNSCCSIKYMNRKNKIKKIFNFSKCNTDLFKNFI